MNKDQIKNSLEKVDRMEAAIDKCILTIAGWVTDKPWTARAVLAVTLILMAFAAVQMLF